MVDVSSVHSSVHSSFLVARNVDDGELHPGRVYQSRKPGLRRQRIHHPVVHICVFEHLQRVAAALPLSFMLRLGAGFNTVGDHDARCTVVAGAGGRRAARNDHRAFVGRGMCHPNEAAVKSGVGCYQ